MKKWFIVISWTKRSPAKLYLVSSKVAMKMNGNTNFPASPIASADHEKANLRLNTAYANRKNGDAAKIELADAVTEVDGMMRRIISYAEFTAEGSQAMLETTGFDISNGEPKKSVVPEVPFYLKLTSSKNSVTMRTKRTTGATGYCWVVFVGGAITPINVVNNNIAGPIGDNVIIINPGKTRQVLSNLAVGTLITVMVLAQSTAGKSAFSAQASVYVNK